MKAFALMSIAAVVVITSAFAGGPTRISVTNTPVVGGNVEISAPSGLIVRVTCSDPVGAVMFDEMAGSTGQDTYAVLLTPLGTFDFPLSCKASVGSYDNRGRYKVRDTDYFHVTS